MTGRERVAVGLLGGAVALGVVGDLLFHGRPIGLNAGLFAAAFVLALAALLRLRRVPLHQGRRLMAAPLVLFAALLAWHDSPLLLATNLLAVAGAVALGALRRTRTRVATADFSDYAVGAASVGVSAFVGAMELVEKDVPWSSLGTHARGRGAAVGRGLAIGLPLLLLFGGLFVAADQVFANLLASSVPDVRRLWSHVLIAIGIGWLAAGLLRDLLASREEERLVGAAVAASARRRPTLGTTEIAVALGVVDVLFVAFVAVQVRYLFGGRTLVESRADLTYADYARHGFFELAAVALLVLPLLLGAHAVARRRSRVVQALSGLLIALVLVVMASALERMRLYQREYGLTELRVYATGLIFWLACVFVWLRATVVPALNAANPDALIARTNLARPHVDATYLGRLSDDAVPVLVDRLPSLALGLRRSLASELLVREPVSGGALAWNASRAHATALLRARRTELERLASAGG